MKKSAFCILSLLLLLLLYNFWWNGNWYDNIQTTSTGCATDCTKFTASNIPANLGNKNENQPYKYVWCYSDGTYDYGILPAEQSSNDLVAEHTFPSGSSNSNTLLQLVPTYDDKDKPKHFAIGANPVGFTPTSPALIDSGEHLLLEYFHLPRRGDTLVYILQYGNRYDTIINGNVQLNFDTNAMQIGTLYTFNGETTTPLNYANSDGKLIVNYENLDTNYYRNIFIVFIFPEDANENIEEVTFTMKLNAETGIGEPQTTQDTVTLEYLAESAPHDPNYITADKPELCPDPIPDSLIYTIVFQNIGEGDCDMVTVKEILPVNFLLDATGSDIRMIDPPGLLPDSINLQTREIVWKMSHLDELKKEPNKSAKKLRGTNESPKNFTEGDTKDSIVFRVMFDKNIPLIPCSAIPNRAEIIFEDLEPIVTNDYIATIKCTNCDSCTTTPGIEVLPAIKTKKGKAVTLTLPKNKTQFATHYTWYPPLGLDDPGSATPKATLNKNTVYTAIASGGCRQEIFKVPVMVTAKAKCACKGFWHCLWHCKWWLLFIILALIAWLLLRRRGGEA
jgi:hypothetical protein